MNHSRGALKTSQPNQSKCVGKVKKHMRGMNNCDFMSPFKKHSNKYGETDHLDGTDKRDFQRMGFL